MNRKKLLLFLENFRSSLLSSETFSKFEINLFNISTFDPPTPIFPYSIKGNTHRDIINIYLYIELF